MSIVEQCWQKSEEILWNFSRFRENGNIRNFRFNPNRYYSNLDSSTYIHLSAGVQRFEKYLQSCQHPHHNIRDVVHSLHFLSGQLIPIFTSLFFPLSVIQNQCQNYSSCMYLLFNVLFCTCVRVHCTKLFPISGLFLLPLELVLHPILLYLAQLLCFHLSEYFFSLRSRQCCESRSGIWCFFFYLWFPGSGFGMGKNPDLG